MPDEPPSILPRGTIMRPSRRPFAQPPASAVSIQSVSGSACRTGQAAGISSAAGGRPPASINATRTFGSSDSRAAITAPAEPAPTTTKSTLVATGGNVVAVGHEGNRPGAGSQPSVAGSGDGSGPGRDGSLQALTVDDEVEPFVAEADQTGDARVLRN